MASSRRPLGYQKLVVGVAAVGLTPPRGASFALMRIEGNDVRYRDDGVDPTAAEGMLLVAANKDILEYDGQLSMFKAIRTGGVDGTLYILYYDLP